MALTIIFMQIRSCDHPQVGVTRLTKELAQTPGRHWLPRPGVTLRAELPLPCRREPRLSLPAGGLSPVPSLGSSIPAPLYCGRRTSSPCVSFSRGISFIVKDISHIRAGPTLKTSLNLNVCKNFVSK